MQYSKGYMMYKARISQTGFYILYRDGRNFGRLRYFSPEIKKILFLKGIKINKDNDTKIDQETYNLIKNYV